MINNQITWVLVADGHNARIYNKKNRNLEKIPGMRFEAELENEFDLEHNKPSKVFESSGSAKHASEPRENISKTIKERFAIRLTEILSKAADGHLFNKLIIVSPPAFLGMIRKNIGSNVEKMLIKEINKDLVQYEGAELVKHFEELVV